MSTTHPHITKQLGVWTVHLRERNTLSRVQLPNLARLCRDAARSTVRAVLGLEVLESAGADAHTLDSKVEPDGSATADSARHKRPNRSIVHLFLQLVKDIHSLGPALFYTELLCEAWNVVEGALTIYTSNKLLEATTMCLEGETCSQSSVLAALLLRLCLEAVREFVVKKLLSVCLFNSGKLTDAGSRRLRCEVLQTRVFHHFRLKAIRDAVRLDIGASKDPSVRAKLGENESEILDARNEAWSAFNNMCSIFFDIVRIFSSATVFIGFSSTSIIAYTAMLGVVRQLIFFTRKFHFKDSYVMYCSNLVYRRMAGLDRLVFTESFREDALNNDVSEYVLREYDSCRETMGDTSIKSGWALLHNQEGAMWQMFLGMQSDFPIILFAIMTMFKGPGLTVAALLMLQQMQNVVNGTIWRLVYEMRRLSKDLQIIENIYTLGDVENKVKDGEAPYPSSNPDNVSEVPTSSGAKIEFRNVSFRYPGADKDAISDISFVIPAGHLVVIVGVNGSGKSSTVKLLTRLYDPTEGVILLDDEPLPSYKLADVRRHTAVLRQSHPVLPLSLHENVAIGLPSRRATDAEVQEALRLGGASRFVGKLTEGTQTVLEPITGSSSHLTQDDADSDLRDINEKLEKETDLSGGETQRLSASRLFMRLMGGETRLLVADEPTSALDPEGEFELFSRLREHRGGKTVIFITHRFGHLTRHADLILCLKDGRLVEHGTHASLLARGGEYKKLHSVQAQAFT